MAKTKPGKNSKQMVKIPEPSRAPLSIRRHAQDNQSRGQQRVPAMSMTSQRNRNKSNVNSPVLSPMNPALRNLSQEMDFDVQGTTVRRNPRPKGKLPKLKPPVNIGGCKVRKNSTKNRKPSRAVYDEVKKMNKKTVLTVYNNKDISQKPTKPRRGKKSESSSNTMKSRKKGSDPVQFGKKQFFYKEGNQSKELVMSPDEIDRLGQTMEGRRKLMGVYGQSKKKTKNKAQQAASLGKKKVSGMEESKSGPKSQKEPLIDKAHNSQDADEHNSRKLEVGSSHHEAKSEDQKLKRSDLQGNENNLQGSQLQKKIIAPDPEQHDGRGDRLAQEVEHHSDSEETNRIVFVVKELSSEVRGLTSEVRGLTSEVRGIPGEVKNAMEYAIGRMQEVMKEDRKETLNALADSFAQKMMNFVSNQQNQANNPPRSSPINPESSSLSGSNDKLMNSVYYPKESTKKKSE